ncbi:hypothetical protein BDW62DRAFT_98929 [Aspergillus aurantiobrunneus]
MDSQLASSAIASQDGPDINQKFHCNDACYLKSNPSLMAHVVRTPYDIGEPETLTDLSIYRYTELPDEDISVFISTGVPPKGYTLVDFVDSENGCSLIHENDLELVDRMLELGQPVKRDLNSAMSGTVIGATTKCTLEPIAYQPIDPITGDYLPVRFTEKGSGVSFASELPETSPSLLYNVPQSELSYHEEFSEGDYIIYRQKLGIIRDVDHDAVLLLPNSTIVSPLDIFDLKVPVHTKPAADLSILASGLKKRDVGDGRYMWTSEAGLVFPGQSIFTERSNLSRGDRPPGNQGSLVQAYVLATPTEGIHVEWLCPNVFFTGPQNYEPTSEVLRVSALQGNAVNCDFAESPIPDCPVGRCDSMLDVGDRVRFRDPGAAAMKYPGYQRIPADQTFGHDMNIFRIVSSKTEVVVQWQDGRCTTEVATSLQPSTVKQPGNADVGELGPGELVTLKDDVRTLGKSYIASRLPALHPLRGRMKEILHLHQLGVVQTVESRDQIASVRWYQNKNIKLIYDGNALDPGSSLGRLSDTITNVSVYELATFPALNKHLGDLVVVAPACVDQQAMSPAPISKLTRETALGLRCAVPGTYPDLSLYLQSIKSAMVTSEWFKNTTTIRPPLRRRYSVHNDDAVPSVDFFGKIVGMDTNGIITVRFPGANGCRDIQIPFERIMISVDEADIMEPMSLSFFNLWSSGSQDGSSNSHSEDEFNIYDISEISEIGDGWAPEDESDDSLDSHEVLRSGEKRIEGIEASEVLMSSDSEICLDDLQVLSERETTPDNKPASVSQGSILTQILRFPAPASSPRGFAVLEDLPPSDHHFMKKDKSASFTLRMKSIRKEFGILETSLPPGIFVRSWESRMDLLRVMVIGPEGTPYEHAPFVIDMQFSPDFPSQPPSTFFHSWTTGQGQINPNMYEDGKICLSILGTWPTQYPDENWSPGKSTILQVLVSIMGLVLVKNPFYNEAGYEVLAAEDNRRVESSRYTEKVFLMTRKFILHALEYPVPGLEDILIWNYLPGPTSRPQLLRKAIQGALRMIEHHNRTPQKTDQGPQASAFCSRLSLGAVMVLQRHVSALEKLESDIIS